MSTISQLDYDVAGLASVRTRLARACGDNDRPESTVKLVTVSKGFDAKSIQRVLAAGERIFGENRVQEAEQKWPELRVKHPGVELHLIGPLQSNKAADAVALFDVIQTVDRPKIARAIAQAMRFSGKKNRLFVQVNTGKESQKAGVAPSDLAALIKFCRDEENLTIQGLMCIPPLNELASPHFALLTRLAAEFSLSDVSMGMSDDFELAIQLGATYVRVGSAIFGTRRYDAKSPISI